MPSLRYPLVLLDVGDTLIGPRESFGSVYASVFAGLGVLLPPSVWERGLRSTWLDTNRSIPVGADRYRFWPGGETEYWLRFVEGTLRRTPGAPDDHDLALRALDSLRDAFREPSAWHVFDDVVPTLERLIALGVRLAVVSNWDSRLPGLLERLRLARYFDAVLVSHLEGLEKPCPELFHRALARLGGRAADALHVGDRPEIDGAGAAAAGIAGVLVDRRGRLESDCRALRDLTTLPELARNGVIPSSRGS